MSQQLLLWTAALVARSGVPLDASPLFHEYCWDCHGDGADEGGFAIDAYRDVDALVADRKRWAKARLLLDSHIMPPAGRRQPSLEQRRALVDWIDRTVFPVDRERPDPGRAVLRRLNRAEYNNAVGDVFGVDSRPADAFPPDDTGYGFDTIGDVLTLSPILLEKLLFAARQVVDEATLPRAVPQVGFERTGGQLQALRGDVRRAGKVAVLRGRAAEVGADVDIHTEAVYRLVLQAASAKAGGAFARVDVRCDGKRIATVDVDEPWRETRAAGGGGTALKRFSVLLPLPAGRRRISLRLRNPDRAGTRAVAIQGFRLRGPFSPVTPAAPSFLTRLARVAGSAIATATPRLALSGEDTEPGEGRSNGDTGAVWFATNGYRFVPLALGEAGRYRIRLRVGAQQAGGERARFELRVGGQRLGPFTVNAAEQRHEWIECEAELPAGRTELQIWFLNAYRDEATKAERWLWLHELTLEGPLGSREPLAHAEVPRLLAWTARRLFRRPISQTESGRLTELARRVEKAGLPPLAALRQGLMGLLAAPSFVYWNAPRPAGTASRGSMAIDEISLASRLSAFLWSSVPDEELLALAEAGDLRRSFRSQVARMLADPRARALTENFAGQWLELRNMTLVAPDAAAFPDFTAELAADMRHETELLFEHVLKENKPIVELLTADYTFVTARLAAHYGLDEPRSRGEPRDASRFRRVSLEGTLRRGILTHGSLLTFTSHPNRTSPVKRGKFILEKILGTPPPAPPVDVPPLAEASPGARAATTRDRLEEHRKNRSCASCHAFMDPLGLAFERYDAIGRFRETEQGERLDTSGRLVTGAAFNDAEELREILVRDRAEDVVRSLAEQLLTYALGRGLEYTDRPALDEITARARPGGWRLQDVIVAICESVPFQRMRAEEARHSGASEAPDAELSSGPN